MPDYLLLTMDYVPEAWMDQEKTRPHGWPGRREDVEEIEQGMNQNLKVVFTRPPN